MRSRSCRVIKPRRPDFDYFYMLPCAYVLRPSTSSSALEANLQACPSTSSSIKAHLQSHFSYCSPLEALPRSLTSRMLFRQLCLLPVCVNNLPEVPPLLQENKIRREQRARVERLGESVHWLLEPDGLERLAFMSKSSDLPLLPQPGAQRLGRRLRQNHADAH